MTIDLHLHSSASDGSDKPQEVVKKVKDNGIDVMALTDHDTVGGVSDAMEEGARLGVKVLSGIELSAFSTFEVHILGYNIDIHDDALRSKLDALKAKRKERAARIIDKLSQYKIYLDKEQLLSGDCIGRPHIAGMLLKGGYVKSIQEAFDRYLGKKGLAFVPSDRLSPLAAVSLIKEAGGKAVIAHPLVFCTKGVIEDLICGLKDYGLDGIEAYYPSHSHSDIVNLLALAKKYDLIATGGTDYHGAIRNISPGSVRWSPDVKTARALGLK